MVNTLSVRPSLALAIGGNVTSHLAAAAQVETDFHQATAFLGGAQVSTDFYYGSGHNPGRRPNTC
jgi:hypothetical protein